MSRPVSLFLFVSFLLGGFGGASASGASRFSSNPPDSRGARPARESERRPVIEHPDCPVCAAAERLGMRMVPMRLPRVDRCVHEDTEQFHVLYPQGLVRAEDLDELRLVVGNYDRVFERMDDLGHPEVHFGPADEVRRPPGDIEWMSQAWALPREMARAALGSVGTCGLRTRSGGYESLATFRLIALSPREREDLDAARAVDERLPAGLRGLVEARYLLGRGLDSAGFRLVERVLSTNGDEPHALALRWLALGRMRARSSETGAGTAYQMRDKLRVRSVGAATACRAFEVDAERTLPGDDGRLEPGLGGCGG